MRLFPAVLALLSVPLPLISPLGLVLLFLAAVGAGVMNSMAGGGTLLTFPSLLAAGVTPVAANATNAVALVPGSFSAGWAYRDDLGRLGARPMAWLMTASAVGGFVGAKLVAIAGDALFRRMVPWLILGATVLFVVQGPLQRRRERRASVSDTGAEPALGGANLRGLAGAHLLVSVYGGFFGAGMGILMLAELGFAGLANIHQMNGIKNFGAALINLTAAVAFLAGGHVHVRLAALMAVGAILGGWGGGKLAQLIGQRSVRWVVVTIGVMTGLATLIRA
jgi:uncharacterized membrane protein YfcA